MGADQPPSDDEAVRLAMCEPCELEHGHVRLQGTIWNVSRLGIYVVLSDVLPDVGASVHVTFALPDDPTPISVQARVAWQNPPSPYKGLGLVCGPLPAGCGLEFVDLREADRERIRARVALTRRAVPGVPKS